MPFIQLQLSNSKYFLVFTDVHSSRAMNTETEEKTQGLKVLAALAEDLGLVASTHTAAHHCL